MRDKNGKESTVTRWVDDQGQQQIVSLDFLILNTLHFYIQAMKAGNISARRWYKRAE
jgi:hypothetical protein